MNRNLEIAVGSVLAAPPPPQMLAEFDGWVKKEIGEQAAAISSVAEYRRLWQGWASQTSFINLDQPLSKLGGLHVERTLGSSKLTETIEIAEKHLFRPGSIFLGRSIEFDILQAGTSPEKVSAPLGHVGEGHGLVVADTRFGKLVRVLQPTIATWPGSLVAIDNSGELASINAERRGHGNPDYCEGLGQDVFVLDPQNATNVPDQYRATWNPLDCLILDDPECIDKAETLADALLPQEQQASDPYWKDEGKSFIAALFIFVATEERFTSCGENTLNTVFALMSAGDEDLLTYLRERGDLKEDEGDPIELLFSGMKTTLGPNYVTLKGKHLDQLHAGARKQWEGIRSQAQSALSWVEKPTMKACLASSSLSFADLKTNPNGMSVFISLKDLSSEWRWIRMVLSMLAVQSKTYDDPATGHSTLVVVDEFPKLKPMPVILDFLDCMAKHRVRMLIVCQSIDQLEEVYPKSWHRFFAAADIRWFFGAESHRTRKFLEDELGQTEIMRLTRSQAEAIGYSTNSSMSASENRGENTSTARTIGQNETWSQGSSEGTSENWGNGWSRGDSYKESVLGLVPWLNRVPLLKGATRSRGRNGSVGGGSNTGTSSSAGGGSSVSETQTGGTSNGTGRSQTTGGSEQFTGTQTISETLHKGPVIQAADLPYVIADVDDPNDPRYPGQALVSVRGGVRFLVRTTRYFEDPMLYRCFGKHPAHPFKQAKIPWHIWAALDYKDRMIWEEMKRRFGEVRLELSNRQAFLDFDAERAKIAKAEELTKIAEKHIAFLKKERRFGFMLEWEDWPPDHDGRSPYIVAVAASPVRKGDPILRLTSGNVLHVAPCDGTLHKIEKCGDVYRRRFEIETIKNPIWLQDLINKRHGSEIFRRFENESKQAFFDFLFSEESDLSPYKPHTDLVESASSPQNSLVANWHDFQGKRSEHQIRGPLEVVYDAADYFIEKLELLTGKTIAGERSVRLCRKFFQYYCWLLGFMAIGTVLMVIEEGYKSIPVAMMLLFVSWLGLFIPYKLAFVFGRPAPTNPLDDPSDNVTHYTHRSGVRWLDPYDW